MDPINILDAKNSLSRLVAAASAGDDVVIARRGTPLVRLVPVESGELTAGAAAVRLTRHPVPTRTPRTPAQLDAQIVAEREGWE
ncbi:type II toxin-antitoxin system prevent-host-death family antitoxin [Galbitalea sp. SE-J8]|uniref:type II toxin-antitoxin system Phd/YefM family antitoxin n=1 Tax=Galbitalea sp. SE-J8 TaxID=3054952 RepID=UPI00259D1BFE|nr:type II toxin-antitoxin system prevent-host-death family antitoxin [Galbitalea sp. SE-J8]MDM4764274.1 type II toxin-antitoxin system prevent-host-death family antitoxin [Galbitalea sp. SE-J8]